MSDTVHNAEIERLAAGSYVALTTYRKDGRAVPTPVWVSSDGHKLFVLTEADSGKVKRIRNRGHVMVAPCDMRGAPQGAAVDASARILDAPADVALVQKLHKAKYKSQFSLLGLLGRVFRRNGAGRVGIELTIA
jgi:PPOX class probable F420-dependent enzyme